jgi:hypothetical protein
LKGGNMNVSNFKGLIGDRENHLCILWRHYLGPEGPPSFTIHIAPLLHRNYE